MSNFLTCKNCNTINPLFAYTCKKCNAFLRTKIPNIDFWAIVSLLLESPVKAAETIIQSEHKNYIISLSIFAGIKLTLNFWILNNALSLSEEINNNFLVSTSLGLVGFFTGLIIISFLGLITSKFRKIETRFTDFLSVYIYSFVPIIFLFIFLTPIQLALFGTYWFSFNPSPFFIKELPSYVIVIIEGIFYLWSIFILICTNYAQLRKIFISIFLSVVELIILSFTIFLGLYLSKLWS